MKKISIVAIALILAVGLNAKGLGSNHTNIVTESKDKDTKVKPRYQGVVIEVLDAKEYTYLKIDEKVHGCKSKDDKTHGCDSKDKKLFWIVVDRTSAKVGDYVRFKKELVTQMFKSKILNKNFDEVMFASNLEYRVSK